MDLKKIATVAAGVGTAAFIVGKALCGARPGNVVPPVEEDQDYKPHHEAELMNFDEKEGKERGLFWDSRPDTTLPIR
jgi:hypothetical protein